MYKWGGPRPYPAFVLFCLNKKARFAVVAGVLTLSLKKLPMLFCFNYQRLNYFV